MEVDLTKLRQLVVIARTGNFTRAAEELGITQPALSRNVAGLESRFGIHIFDRGRSGATVTATGAQIVEQAEALLRQASILEHNLHLYGRGEGGHIAIGMGPQIAAVLLPKLGAHMLTTRPQLRVQCSLQTMDILLPELRDGSIEMIVCASDHFAPSPDIRIEALGVIRLAIIARAGHPIQALARVTLSDLAAYPIAIESAQLPRPFPTGSGGLSCENSQILRDVVLESDALWFSSPEIVASDILAGRLVEVDVADLPFRQIEVGVMRLAQRTISPAADAITAFARKLLRQPGTETPDLLEPPYRSTSA